MANKIQDVIQYNAETSPQIDDVWGILWRQSEPEVEAIGFARQPFAKPEWWWIWHGSKLSKIYDTTTFILNNLHWNLSVLLGVNFLTPEHELSFGFVPYQSSVLIYKNRPLGLGYMAHWRSCKWRVTQQRDSRTCYVAAITIIIKYKSTDDFPWQNKHCTVIVDAKGLVPIHPGITRHNADNNITSTRVFSCVRANCVFSLFTGNHVICSLYG